jgi:hypothetical protein
MPMPGEGRPYKAALVVLLALVVSACGTAASSPSAAGATSAGSSPAAATSASAGAMPSSQESAGNGAGDFTNVDVCNLATTDEITAVMGETAHDPQPSVIGPGAAIDSATGCTWSLGDSIDLFDIWIYPSADKDLKSALGDYWTGGYQVEPLSGIGDEAYAVVWRGDASIRTVGQVAGVGVRQGGKSVLISTLRIGGDYLDPNPAAQLALKVLGRF